VAWGARGRVGSEGKLIYVGIDHGWVLDGSSIRKDREALSFRMAIRRVRTIAKWGR
jgi:hypothetical protein